MKFWHYIVITCIWISFLALLIIGVQNLVKKIKPSIEPIELPKIHSCEYRQIIILDLDKKWPKNSISGCKCILEYQGISYISREDSPNNLCKNKHSSTKNNYLQIDTINSPAREQLK